MRKAAGHVAVCSGTAFGSSGETTASACTGGPARPRLRLCKLHNPAHVQSLFRHQERRKQWRVVLAKAGCRGVGVQDAVYGCPSFRAQNDTSHHIGCVGARQFACAAGAEWCDGARARDVCFRPSIERAAPEQSGKTAARWVQAVHGVPQGPGGWGLGLRLPWPPLLAMGAAMCRFRSHGAVPVSNPGRGGAWRSAWLSPNPYPGPGCRMLVTCRSRSSRLLVGGRQSRHAKHQLAQAY